MKLEDRLSAIAWLRDMLLKLEEVIHAIHAWLMGEDTENTWPGRVIKTDSEAAKAFEEVEAE